MAVVEDLYFAELLYLTVKDVQAELKLTEPRLRKDRYAPFAGMIDPAWLDGVNCIGLTAGASAPEIVVQDVLAYLATLRPISIEELDGKEERVRFRLPDRLTKKPNIEPADALV